ncbi:MAG: aminotransferase class V-fold PLP-dependent enzyme [candidate division KSB1 bacterium]|nr:aminotransferase class V-fold PLP-dependent enzyme [candidate division KSB1 bacterium]
MDRIINFDHGSATQPLPEVVESMMPFLKDNYGNPSSMHVLGQQAKAALDKARAQVAALINSEPEEIVFTASGSESNNFALKGVAFGNRKKGDHIIVSAIEHFSVLQAAKSLEKLGYQITQIPVDKDGLVDPDDVKKAITDKTILISVHHANPEIGTIEPIEEIGKIAREKGVLFHTDAIQTAGTIPVDVKKLNVDLLSLAANAFYGPKGAAALYIRKGARINPLIDGGTQEGGRRAGTENLLGIVGMGAAAELALRDMDKRIAHVQPLRDLMIQLIEEKIDHVYLHGHRTQRLPNNVNFGFEFIEGESILLFLGMSNIIASSGSACTSKALKASHVLLGIGQSHAIANGTILFTLGIDNTEEDIRLLGEKLPGIVERLRSMSPLYKK